jgi:hypothetical protein
LLAGVFYIKVGTYVTGRRLNFIRQLVINQYIVAARAELYMRKVT